MIVHVSFRNVLNLSALLMFASEMIGAVRDVDPCTGHFFDDTGHYTVDSGLAPEALADIHERNARTVYPRLDALLTQQGR